MEAENDAHVLLTSHTSLSSPARKKQKQTIFGTSRGARNRIYAPSGICHSNNSQSQICEASVTVKLVELERGLLALLGEMLVAQTSGLRDYICAQVVDVSQQVTTAIESTVSPELEMYWIPRFSQIKEKLVIRMANFHWQTVEYKEGNQQQVEERLVRLQSQVDEVFSRIHKSTWQQEPLLDSTTDKPVSQGSKEMISAATLLCQVRDPKSQDERAPTVMKDAGGANESPKLPTQPATKNNACNSDCLEMDLGDLVHKRALGDCADENRADSEEYLSGTCPSLRSSYSYQRSTKKRTVSEAEKNIDVNPLESFAGPNKRKWRGESNRKIASFESRHEEQQSSGGSSSSESFSDSDRSISWCQPENSSESYNDSDELDDDSDNGSDSGSDSGSDNDSEEEESQDQSEDRNIHEDDGEISRKCKRTNQEFNLQSSPPYSFSNVSAETASIDVPNQAIDSPQFRPFAIGQAPSPAGCFIDGGAGLLLAGADGVCCFYDSVSWQEKCQFIPPEGFILGSPGGCWLLSTQWHDSEDTSLVVVTSRDSPAFCSWHFETGAVAGYWSVDLHLNSFDCVSTDSDDLIEPGTPVRETERTRRSPFSMEDNVEDNMGVKLSSSGREGYLEEILKAMDMHTHDLETGGHASSCDGSFLPGRVSEDVLQADESGESVMSWQDVTKRRWWIKPSGPVLAVVSAGKRGLQLIDVRDGQVLLKVQLERPVAELENSSPIQWIDRRRLVVAEEGRVSLWDLGSGRAQLLKFISLPEEAKEVTALTCLELKDSDNSRLSREQSWPENNCAFSTKEALYLIDWHLPDSVKLRIDYNQFHPPDCLFLDHCFLYAGVQGTARVEHTRILKWNNNSGELVDCFFMAEGGERERPTTTGPVTQLWAGFGKVFGVHPKGLFVYNEENNWSHSRPKEGEPLHFLSSAIGCDREGGLACASFDGAGDQMLIMTANHVPTVYTGV